ncbi:Alpha-tocopherol transfer protein [Schistosoma japonicum]|nr:Alpha-tocopherol transfer protein [Schistosoma japonicum]
MGSDVNVVELTPQTLEKAFLELNENPQQRQSAIAELRSRIQLQNVIRDRCWPAVQVHGVIILVDLSGFYWKHAINLMSPWFLRCAVHFLQGSSPVRVKSVHIFNSPYIFSKIYSTLMPLLKPKNQAREYIDGLLNLEDYFIEMNKFPYHVNSIASM